MRMNRITLYFHLNQLEFKEYFVSVNSFKLHPIVVGFVFAKYESVCDNSQNGVKM